VSDIDIDAVVVGSALDEQRVLVSTAEELPLTAQAFALSAADEKAALENEKLKIGNLIHEDERDRLKKLDALRHQMLEKLLRLVTWWLVAVGVFLGLSAVFGVASGHCFIFHLSDPVLLAFISSTTVAVLGLFLVAAKWLFPNGKSSDTGAKPSPADAPKS
jgi:hypothetical protein